jgi:hypothetical protein
VFTTIPCIRREFIVVDDFLVGCDSVSIDDYETCSGLCSVMITCVSREFVFADDFRFDCDDL